MVRNSHGNDEAPALGQLVHQRLRNSRRGSCDQNRVIRRAAGQTLRTIPFFDAHIRVAQPRQPLSRRRSKRWNRLQRNHLASEQRQHGGLISGSRRRLPGRARGPQAKAPPRWPRRHRAARSSALSRSAAARRHRHRKQAPVERRGGAGRIPSPREPGPSGRRVRKSGEQPYRAEPTQSSRRRRGCDCRCRSSVPKLSQWSPALPPKRCDPQIANAAGLRYDGWDRGSRREQSPD